MKSESAERSSDVQSAVDSVLIHDLRGPTLNAMAFSNEVADAAERLCAILADPARAISAEERQELSEILEHDMNPCISYVQKALKTMETRLTNLDYSS